jgi:hypothetical protein
MDMKKERGPRIDVEISAPAATKTRLYVDEDVANVLRKVARVERVELGPFLETLLRYWLKHERPQWKLIEQVGDDASKAADRKTPKRTK